MRAPAFLCLGLVACEAAVVGEEEPRRPNLVLIVADDLGFGDLSCYGQETLRTPNLDRLAAEGMRFTQFYAGSTVCAPSRCVLMTGLHTGHCQIRGNSRDNLDPEQVTVAEVLRAAGYATGLVGKWGLGHEDSDGLPTRQGFDEFFGYLNQRHAHNFYPTFLIRGEERVQLDNVVPEEGPDGSGVATVRAQYSHDLFTEEALSFVERHADEPFFLYLAYTVPHANNEAGKRGMEVPELGAFAEEDWPEPAKGFAAMLARLDTDVGRLVAKLDELGIGDDTLVLFTSDNGPHSEGGHKAQSFASNGPLTGKKRDLTEGGIRVPGIARWPAVVEAGTVSEQVAAFQDVLPTFGELAGAAAVPANDGVSLVSTLEGTGALQERTLYWAFYERGAGRALRHGKYKAVQQPMSTAMRVYDLEADIAEQHDLAGAEIELARELARLMDDAYVFSPRWQFPQIQPPDK